MANAGIIVANFIIIETGADGINWSNVGNGNIISDTFWQDVKWREFAKSLGLVEGEEDGRPGKHGNNREDGTPEAISA